MVFVEKRRLATLVCLNCLRLISWYFLSAGYKGYDNELHGCNHGQFPFSYSFYIFGKLILRIFAKNYQRNERWWNWTYIKVIRMAQYFITFSSPQYNRWSTVGAYLHRSLALSSHYSYFYLPLLYFLTLTNDDNFHCIFHFILHHCNELIFHSLAFLTHWKIVFFFSKARILL